MKTLFKAIIFLSFFTINAQTVSILDHVWTIEKVVTVDQTILADLNEEGVYDRLILEETDISNFYFYQAFGDCEAVLDIDEAVQDFYINYFVCAITSYGSDISVFFNGTFIFQEGGVAQTDDGDVYGPFTYLFREEVEFIYLDISNIEGSVATFWTSTLNTANFEMVNFSIYPNPTTHLLHIESEEASIESLEIFNLEGKRVLQTDYNQNQPIVVEHLSKGLYLLKILTAKGSLTKKFVKE